MVADRSELASLSALLAQVTERITAMGEAASAAHEQEAKELFGIERALIGAQRRVTRLITSKR